eukprot:scaffold1397_cov122-Isochrysis_galbana.AAC.5
MPCGMRNSAVPCPCPSPNPTLAPPAPVDREKLRANTSPCSHARLPVPPGAIQARVVAPPPTRQPRQHCLGCGSQRCPAQQCRPPWQASATEQGPTWPSRETGASTRCRVMAAARRGGWADATTAHTSTAIGWPGAVALCGAASAAAADCPVASSKGERRLRAGAKHRLPARGSGVGRGTTPSGRSGYTLCPFGVCTRNRHDAGMKCICTASRYWLVGLAAACQVRPLKSQAPPSWAARWMYWLEPPLGASERARLSSAAPRSSRVRVGSCLQILQCLPVTSCALRFTSCVWVTR